MFYEKNFWIPTKKREAVADRCWGQATQPFTANAKPITALSTQRWLSDEHVSLNS